MLEVLLVTFALPVNTSSVAEFAQAHPCVVSMQWLRALEGYKY